MKLGLLTAILPDHTLEQCMEIAGAAGYRCLEAACWPSQKESRRYAGASHLDLERFDSEEARKIKALCGEKGMELSALCYYPNPLSPDRQVRSTAVTHLKKLIQAARMLDIEVVNTFIGRDKDKTVGENLKMFQRVWPELIRMAEDCGVKLGIENCPMYFTEDEWPGGCNLAVSPAIWQELFALADSPNLGLNYDPSHLVLQRMDHIAPLYEFRDRIFHVHLKDIRIHRDKLDRVGVFAPPLRYMSPKIPGLGCIQWGEFISSLRDVGYRGAVCVEVEDRAFEDSEEDILTAIRLSYRHVSQYLD